MCFYPQLEGHGTQQSLASPGPGLMQTYTIFQIYISVIYFRKFSAFTLSDITSVPSCVSSISEIPGTYMTSLLTVSHNSHSSFLCLLFFPCLGFKMDILSGMSSKSQILFLAVSVVETHPLLLISIFAFFGSRISI